MAESSRFKQFYAKCLSPSVSPICEHSFLSLSLFLFLSPCLLSFKLSVSFSCNALSCRQKTYFSNCPYDNYIIYHGRGTVNTLALIPVKVKEHLPTFPLCNRFPETIDMDIIIIHLGIITFSLTLQKRPRCSTGGEANMENSNQRNNNP